MPDEKLCTRSGEVWSHSKLVSFLYQLMRDHVSFGVVEKLCDESQVTPCLFTNGWLAQYAKDLASRLEETKRPAENLTVTSHLLDLRGEGTARVCEKPDPGVTQK